VSHRRRHAPWLAAALVACGGSTAASVADVDPWPELLASARIEQRDIVIRLEEETILRIVGEPKRSPFDRLVEQGATYGVVAFDLVFVDEPKARDQRLPRIPEPVRGLLLPFPSGGSVGNEPPGLSFYLHTPVDAFLDADGRPFAGLDYRALGDQELRAEVERARDVRRRRDAAFAEAAKAKGTERTAALLRGLEVMDRWFVVRCYAGELAELAASGEPDAVVYARPLLREHQVLQACQALDKASRDIRTMDPRRLRRQLDEVVAQSPDLPEVAVLAHCVQGASDLLLALDESDRDRTVERVRAATRSIEVELTWIRQAAEVWLLMASAWQPQPRRRLIGGR
jgi:hypothetical protein